MVTTQTSLRRLRPANPQATLHRLCRVHRKATAPRRMPCALNSTTHVRIAALQQQLAAAQEAQVRAELPPPAEHPAKQHALSLLQKLEAGEAIVLGDLQSRLRAFVDAL
ncbi:TPA: hypothetical protein ACYLIB_005630 [Burkholderia cenocepacia]